MALQIVFAVLSLPPAVHAAAREPSSFAAELEARAESRRRRYRVPGAQVALLQSGELVFEGGFGRAASGRRVTPQTRFQVASISKPVTALGVLALAAEGRLDLDAPVSEVLRRWQLPDAGFDTRAVTARRLLSHQAGVSIHGYPGFLPTMALPSLEASLGGQTGGAGGVRLIEAPGSAVRYSGGGYTILQLAVEEISGTTFAEFMQRRVLLPLGMQDSSFVALDEPAASGHGWWGGELPSYRFTAQAASGLNSTAGDLARFLAAFSNGAVRERLGIDDALARQMWSLQTPIGPELFALGFALEQPLDLGIVSHSGSNRGWRALLVGRPASGDGLVVLTNSERGLPLASDLACGWSAAVAEPELASCWVTRKGRGATAAIAGLLAIGLLMDFWGYYRRYWGAQPRRLFLYAEKFPVVNWLRLSLALAVVTLWWVFWYTDRIVVRREGIDNFIPVSTMPSTFVYVTFVLSVWAGLGVARSVAAHRTRRRLLAGAAAC